MRLRALGGVLGLLLLAGCDEPPKAGAHTPARPAPTRTPGGSLDLLALEQRLRERGLARVAKQLVVLAKNCLRLRRHDGKGTSPPTSRLGGQPDLPAATPWPEWEGRPLAFLAQLRLDELPGGTLAGLPSAGLLSFFYTQDQSTWGFRPSDRGSFRVLFTPDASACRTRAFPAAVATDQRFTSVPLAATVGLSLPSSDHENVLAMDLSDAESDALSDLDLDLPPEPMHQLGGYATPIQGDTMQAECAMLAEGVDLSDGRAWNSAKVPQWTRDGQKWRLLLQLDSDDNAGWMWGDAGILYFWIRDSDLARGHFEDVWMVMQCS